MDNNQIKEDILSALSHPEAEDGLYFRNFANLHEEDERPVVRGSQVEILDALKILLEEGTVVLQEGDVEAVFHLSSKQ